MNRTPFPYRDFVRVKQTVLTALREQEETYVLVAGETGTGKTALLRDLRAELDRARYRVLYFAEARRLGAPGLVRLLAKTLRTDTSMHHAVSCARSARKHSVCCCGLTKHTSCQKKPSPKRALWRRATSMAHPKCKCCSSACQDCAPTCKHSRTCGGVSRCAKRSPAYRATRWRRFSSTTSAPRLPSACVSVRSLRCSSTLKARPASCCHWQSASSRSRLARADSSQSKCRTFLQRWNLA